MRRRARSDPFNMERRPTQLSTPRPDGLASDVLEWAMAAALVVVAAIAVLGALVAR